MAEFVSCHPDNFETMCLACASNYKTIIEQAKMLNPKYLVISDKNAYEIVKNELQTIIVLPGEELNNMAKLDVDIMGMAISGTDGIMPSFNCLGHAKILAIANKEAIVSGGKFFISLANSLSEQTRTRIIPVDSEHNAVYQCLLGEIKEDVSEVILTCSGGPFVDFPENDLQNVTIQQALNHPKWKMGRKITIDSATIMNKALELLEASFLFEIDIQKIKAVIHRQSIVHGIVTFKDASTKAFLSYPDMMIPVCYALNYPDRYEQPGFKLDFTSLTFENFKSWQKRSLEFAYRAYAENKCIVLNTINEKCVYDFLAGKISFCDIQKIIEDTMNSSKPCVISSISDITEAINYAKEVCFS